MKTRIGIFGASQLGRTFLEEIKAIDLSGQIVCFFDNDPKKWDREIDGITILKPTTEHLNQIDYCLVASVYAEEIVLDLLTRNFSNIHTSVASLKRALGINEKDSPETPKGNECGNKKTYFFFKPGRENQAPSPNALPGKRYACTGCANNHLALAKTLA